MKNDLFADVKPDSTCLGYVAFMFMPLETCINIVRNQEKGVLSDWCCMYCFAGSADVTVDGEGFSVNRGELYIYSPARHLHTITSLGKEEEFYAAALDCYNFDKKLAELDKAAWSPPVLSSEALEKHRAEHMNVKKRRLENWEEP